MTDPVYITANGLRAVRHADGALGIIVRNGADALPAAAPAAIHLSAPQAEDLARFLGIVQKATEPPSILDEAREIVAGARRQTHGAPERNSEAIALIWTALLTDYLKPDAKLPPALVNLMMAGMKLVRASKDTRHRDHQLDVVGYVHLNEVCGYVNPK